MDVVATAATTILSKDAKGVAIAIVKPGIGPNGSVTTTYYFGAADAATNRLVGPETQFEIASETKTFTAALLAQALAAGKVQIDDPVSKWVPEGTAVPSRDGQVITLRELVTHRSGLAADPPNLTPNKANYTVELLWAGLNNAQLQSTPGTTWLYSDWGFGLLGTVLSNILMPGHAQPPFKDVVAQNLAGPLGLASTAIETHTSNLAKGYDANGPAPYWDNTAARWRRRAHQHHQRYGAMGKYEPGDRRQSVGATAAEHCAVSGSGSGRYDNGDGMAAISACCRFPAELRIQERRVEWIQ